MNNTPLTENEITERENEMILQLCQEAGEAEVDDQETIIGFRGNHHPATIRAAALGDVAALVRLRTDCGLSAI